MAKRQVFVKATRVYLTIAMLTNATLSSVDRYVKRRFPSLTHRQILKMRAQAVYLHDGPLD